MNIIKKIGIGIASIVAIAICFKIFTIFQTGPEKVCDIVKHWSIAWAKGGVITVIIAGIIFAINHYLRSEAHMSILGIIVLGPLVPFLMTIMFGYSPWYIGIGIVAGIIAGYFSYIIDDHLLELWEIRQIVLPLLFGLGFGGSVIVSCMMENWQDEKIIVTDHSTGTELTIKRYTWHYRSSKNGGSYYSWDHRQTLYFFERGHHYPSPVENIDYTLGTGAFGKKDRVSSEYHDWIGAVPYQKGVAKPFKWIYLTGENLGYQENNWYEAEENFFGQIIKDGKPIEPLGADMDSTKHPLPTESDIPNAFKMTWLFIKIMATHSDFALLRWIYLLVFLPFGLMALFIQQLRTPFLILLVSSSIIMLIIMAIILARSGEKLSSNSFSGFGGGSFGGGGSSSRW